ncbi:MAG: hypothetical protein KC502_20630 [Myxococcales bacterium]|nr:hypothetical protein [Myxococcales bacterium]
MQKLHRVITFIAMTGALATLGTSTFAQAPAMTTVGRSAAKAANTAPEDSWWQWGDRQRRTWISAGLGVQMTSHEGVPVRTTFLGTTAGHSVRVGHWVKPWLALEVDAATADGRHTGLLGGGTARSSRQSIMVGGRLALPVHVSPVIGGHVGVRQLTTDWATHTGGLFANKDTVKPVATGRTDDVALVGQVETGVSASWGPVSVSALMGMSKTLVNETTTVVQAGELGDTKLDEQRNLDLEYRLLAAWRF